MNVSERKLLRFRFLKLLYDATGGDEVNCVLDESIVKALTDSGYTRDEIEKGIRYLESERLICFLEGTGTTTPTRPTGRNVRFTHEGVKEIERAIEKPSEDTQHFPSNVIVIGTMRGGSIQQGTAHSSQISSLLGGLEGRSYVVESSELRARVDEVDPSFSMGGWELVVFPDPYEQHRYASTRELRELLSRVQIPTLYSGGWPCLLGASDTEFGVCCVSPQESLAMAFSGLVVCRLVHVENMCEWKSSIGAPTPTNEIVGIAAGKWLDYGRTVRVLGTLFRFMSSLEKQSNSSVSFEITSTGILDRYLTVANPLTHLDLAIHPLGPTKARHFSYAETLKNPWTEQCATALVEFFDRFEHGFTNQQDMVAAIEGCFK